MADDHRAYLVYLPPRLFEKFMDLFILSYTVIAFEKEEAAIAGIVSDGALQAFSDV